MASATSQQTEKFLKAMSSIYGPFPPSDLSELSSKWSPPATAEGHKGRYLWTDGFAVSNFLTLYITTNETRYLTFAKSLVRTVHDVLGYTRDGRSRLPGATDSHPLNGGLRIGKHDETGSDGDGQYFHYLTVWMFALNRMTYITRDTWYNDQAVDMAKAILPKFMYNTCSARPRMYWKMAMDLSKPLVFSEGNLDPIDGYVVYKLLQETTETFEPTNTNALKDEIALLKKIVDTKWQDYHSTDPLDIGMTLWTLHWLTPSPTGAEEWAVTLQQRALACLSQVVQSGYFDPKIKPTSRRLAFREFGTALGAQCASWPGQGVEGKIDLHDLSHQICSTWEQAGLVPIPTSQQKGKMADLMPITAVMYATALFPGVMKK